LNREEFLSVAPGLLKEIYGRQPISVADWCELPGTGKLSGNTYWYNKRTGEAQWDKPPVVKEQGPDIKEYLKKHFFDADGDGSGSLEMNEFFKMMQGLLLNLSPKQIKRLYNKIDVDGDGTIVWTEFVLHAPEMIAEIVADEESNDDGSFDPCGDWIELPTEDGTATFFYNKRTSHTQTMKPLVLVENEDKNGPDVKDYLKKQFKRADEDGSGELDTAEFWALLKSMLLRLTDEEIAMLYAKVDGDGDGSVEWAEFVLSAPQMIKEIYSKNKTLNFDDEWVELPYGERTYWFNKRTAMSQWIKPDKNFYAASFVDLSSPQMVKIAELDNKAMREQVRTPSAIQPPT
jgi:Ca2+-binding EF-hand superfamily protein